MRIAVLASLALVFLAAPPLRAQWEIEESHTAASLRGIVSLGGGVAWASGSNGTVLRTEDGGYVWQGCAVPPDAAKLDLRGVVAWDEQTAIVMSSGPGSQSRLYRTTDGCRSWTLLLTNDDKAGFWDAVQFSDRRHGVLLGDPVDGQFVLMTTEDGGTTWKPSRSGPGEPVSGESAFAASNSALLVSSPGTLAYCTGGPGGAMVVRTSVGPYSGTTGPGEIPWGATSSTEDLANDPKSSSSGCFSLAESRDGKGTIVAVGGDYTHPERTEDTAWTTAGGAEANKGHALFTFTPSTTRPHGYRSAVAFDRASKTWVAVGPNGTDLSTDDGQTWHALPSHAFGKSKDGDWNALSLPFAVGPNGRIGKLRADALAPVRP